MPLFTASGAGVLCGIRGPGPGVAADASLLHGLPRGHFPGPHLAGLCTGHAAPDHRSPAKTAAGRLPSRCDTVEGRRCRNEGGEWLSAVESSGCYVGGVAHGCYIVCYISGIAHGVVGPMFGPEGRREEGRKQNVVMITVGCQEHH